MSKHFTKRLVYVVLYNIEQIYKHYKIQTMRNLKGNYFREASQGRLWDNKKVALIENGKDE